MSIDFIRTEIDDRVLTVRLDRVDKRNALNRAMYARLADILDSAKKDNGVRVVLLVGHSECFSSGNDLQDAPIEGLDGPHGHFMRALAGFPKPVIAAPSGLAVGVGVTMLFHCDLVFCGETTSFRIPFVPLGVCPEFGSSLLLPRLVGQQRANAILLMGEAFDANSARDMGFVNEVVPNQQVEEFARARAVYLAAQPPLAVRTTKMLLRRAGTPALLDAIAVEMEQLVQLQLGEEAKEAVSAFREKRRPDFSRFA